VKLGQTVWSLASMLLKECIREYKTRGRTSLAGPQLQLCLMYGGSIATQQSSLLRD